jgi:hypothetical protein
VELASTEALSSEVVALAGTARPQVICVAALPPGGVAQARYLCKRLRARYPDVKIVIARWGASGASDDNWDTLLAAGADHVSGSLLETRDQLTRLAALVDHAAAEHGGRQLAPTLSVEVST